MIKTDNVVKIFTGRGITVRAVDGVSTEVPKGEVVVVIGPSGSGKSTFLRCINGLENFDEGHIYIDGVDLAHRKTDMNKVRAEVGTRFCRRCEYCQPCPQDIRISLIMNLHSFWRRFPAERFFTGGIEESVNQAEDCAQCGECEEKCPYHLPIREMLVENLEFYKVKNGRWTTQYIFDCESDPATCPTIDCKAEPARCE